MTIETTTTYVFHTDVGFTKTVIEDVDFSDVEDIIQSKAFSQAQSLRFQHIKGNRSINAAQGPRTIKTEFSTEGGL